MKNKKDEKKCLWCEQKKTGNFILAYTQKGINSCWCCFDCYKKIAPKLNKKNDR